MTESSQAIDPQQKHSQKQTPTSPPPSLPPSSTQASLKTENIDISSENNTPSSSTQNSKIHHHTDNHCCSVVAEEMLETRSQTLTMNFPKAHGDRTISPYHQVTEDTITTNSSQNQQPNSENQYNNLNGDLGNIDEMKCTDVIQKEGTTECDPDVIIVKLSKEDQSNHQEFADENTRVPLGQPMDSLVEDKQHEIISQKELSQKNRNFNSQEVPQGSQFCAKNDNTDDGLEGRHPPEEHKRSFYNSGNASQEGFQKEKQMLVIQPKENQAKISQLETDIRKLEDILLKYRGILQKVKPMLIQKQDALGVVQGRLHSLENENQSIRQDLENTKNALEQIQVEKQGFLSSQNQKDHLIRQLESKVHQLVSDVQSKEKDLEETKLEMKNEKMSMKKHIDELEQMIVSKKEQIKVQEQTIKQIEADVAKWKDESDKYKAASEEIKRVYEEKVSELSDELQQIREELERNKTHTLALESEKKLTLSKLEINKEGCSKLKEANQMIMLKVETLEQQVSEKEKQVSSEHQRTIKLQSKVDVVQKEYNDLKEKANCLESQLNERDLSIKQLSESLHIAEQQNHSFCIEITELKEKQVSYDGEIQQKDKQIDAHIAEIQNANTQIANLEKLLQLSISEKEQLENQNRELQLKCNVMESAAIAQENTGIKQEKEDSDEKNDATNKKHTSIQNNASPQLKRKREVEEEDGGGDDQEIKRENTKKKQRLDEKRKVSKFQKVVVGFSGFKDGLKGFTTGTREELSRIVRDLGGEVISDGKKDQFDPRVTHIVSPPQVRTMKTLAASLTQKWIVHPDWLRQSKQQNAFLEEKHFGFHQEQSPMLNKKIFISSQFVAENKSTKQDRLRHCQILICKYGKGIITRDADESHLMLLGSKEKPNQGKICLTWDGFIDWIYPRTKSDDTNIK